MSGLSLTLVATTNCNLRCDYCLLQPGGRRSADASSWRPALDALLAENRDIVEVVFTGGEPLTVLSLLESTVSYIEREPALRHRVQWSLFTNGLLIDDSVARWLEDHQFSVHLSFDGVPGAQSHRGRATFQKLDALLGRLQDSHPTLFSRLEIAMTVSPATVPLLAPSVDYFLSKEVVTLTANPVMPAPSWARGSIQVLDEQFDRVRRASSAHYERTHTVPLTVFRKQSPEASAAPRKWICGAARTDRVTIDVDGRAYGCVAAAPSYCASGPGLRKAIDALALGRVDAPEFARRFASMPFRAYACGAYTHPEERYSSYRRCADCEYLSRCYACPLSGAADPQWPDARRVPDFVCAWNQVTLAHRDRFPCQPSVGGA